MRSDSLGSQSLSRHSLQRRPTPQRQTALPRAKNKHEITLKQNHLTLTQKRALFTFFPYSLKHQFHDLRNCFFLLGNGAKDVWISLISPYAPGGVREGRDGGGRVKTRGEDALCDCSFTAPDIDFDYIKP